MITDVNDEDAVTAHSGALQASLKLLKSAYTHIRIIVISPTFCMVSNPGGGDPTPCSITNTGYGMLADYMVAGKNIAVYKNITFLDNYYAMGINKDNYKEYLEPDLLLPNARTRQTIAKRIAKVLTPSEWATE